MLEPIGEKLRHTARCQYLYDQHASSHPDAQPFGHGDDRVHEPLNRTGLAINERAGGSRKEGSHTTQWNCRQTPLPGGPFTRILSYPTQPS
jgi:hypothetical protein